jgi:hypothetical protein
MREVTVEVVVLNTELFLSDFMKRAEQEKIPLKDIRIVEGRHQVEFIMHPYDLTDVLSDAIGIVARFHKGEISMTRREED